MGSLFERLGRGAGQALETFGKISLEEQRETRLQAMRDKSSKEDREFRAGESALDRQARTDASTSDQEFRAGESAGDKSFRTSEREASQDFQRSMVGTKESKPDEVTGTPRVDEMTGKTVTTYKSGKQVEYDPETDTTRVLGQGKGNLSEESKAEDKKWAKRLVSMQNEWELGSETDFPYFGNNKDRATDAAEQFRNNARKAGTLDEFDTQVAKKGWAYIDELAGGKDADVEVPAKSSKEAAKEGGALMSIFKDFNKSDYDGIANQIISDPKFPEALKKEARDYLSSGK